MSSCFFSSREKMRISARSESRKCLSTVEPKEPVPPVIIRVLSLKNLDVLIYILLSPDTHPSHPSVPFSRNASGNTLPHSFPFPPGGPWVISSSFLCSRPAVRELRWDCIRRSPLLRQSALFPLTPPRGSACRRPYKTEAWPESSFRTVHFS